MQVKITKKEAKEHGIIISIGYCELQALLSHLSPFAYSSGCNGWSCDYYMIDNVLISTGYSPLDDKNAETSYQLVRDYETKAEKVRADYNQTYKKQKSRLNRLLKNFIKKTVKLGI